MQTNVTPLPTAQTRESHLWRLYVRARGAFDFDPCEDTLKACRAAYADWYAEFKQS